MVLTELIISKIYIEMILSLLLISKNQVMLNVMPNVMNVKQVLQKCVFPVHNIVPIHHIVLVTKVTLRMKMINVFLVVSNVLHALVNTPVLHALKTESIHQNVLAHISIMTLVKLLVQNVKINAKNVTKTETVPNVLLTENLYQNVTVVNIILKLKPKENLSVNLVTSDVVNVILHFIIVILVR